ncbi:sushi, nidogen and EGF-like domain-containing 1, partial [Paramuricea clavata]
MYSSETRYKRIGIIGAIMIVRSMAKPRLWLKLEEAYEQDKHTLLAFTQRGASLCSIEPCVNNGTCREHNDDITCTCASGFTGKRCEAKIIGSLCAIQPCVNNGTCHEKGDDITCTCANGFTGKRCEAKIK